MAFNIVMIISHNYSKHKIIKRSHIESCTNNTSNKQKNVRNCGRGFEPGDLAKSLFAQNA